ncbi:hypothetical protein M422DRAFT_228215 [Sphaerobolus stellatus SS14]|uniref:Cupredoxin n=1 Tax=Sphaerobolus stellatus (strain SS14) TaxID=990650 RepID=A0A0C9UMA8_SPHS4|nr:hypothetical protein M422DRAFT_228215 [Sphaerobolus stellatus SS14]
MLFSLASTVLSLVALTQAVDHAVIVGGPGGVVAFNPTSVNAVVGDTITFTFQQKNHTVTQSSFQNPCTPVEGGFDSGFQPVGADNLSGPFPAASITVQNTDPIWVFCRQTGHCAAGMVFAVNPGAGQLAAFQAAAKATGANSSTAASASTTTTSAAASETTLNPAPAGTTTGTQSTGGVDHKILVGDNGTLTFNPSNIDAQVGDTITFEFRAKNHTISQSSFSQPCRLLGATSGIPGFDSGFMPVPANSTSFPRYTVTVNDTKPIWAYCRQTNPASHCGSGMVFAANAVETGPNNFTAFVELAKELNGTTTAGSGKSNGASSVSIHHVITFVALAFGISFSF